MLHARTCLLYLFLVFLWLANPSQRANADDLQQYYEQGNAALQAGRYAEAEKAYEKLRQLSPATAEIHANLGVIYFQEKKFGQAVVALRQALKLRPALPKAATLLAISLSELGRYKEALPGLEKHFRESADPVAKRMCGLQLERAYTGLHRDTQAVEIAFELARLYPDDPEVLYHGGRLFGNFAFLNMQKLAQIAPNSVWRHQALAEAYESQGSNDQAIREYGEVLALDPNRPGVHYRLGRTLLARSRESASTDDTAKASTEFQQELQQDPSNANAAYELGEIDRNSGQLDEARQFFEGALQYYPDFEEAHLGLAAVLTSLQKPELALPHLQKAIALNPQNDVSWYRLSQVHGMLGNDAERQKALAEFQRLKSRKSSMAEAAREILSPDEVTRQQLEPVGTKQ
jgi:tetratricopeptide (TPR) repeat protein